MNKTQYEESKPVNLTVAEVQEVVTAVYKALSPRL